VIQPRRPTPKGSIPSRPGCSRVSYGSLSAHSRQASKLYTITRSPGDDDSDAEEEVAHGCSSRLRAQWPRGQAPTEGCRRRAERGDPPHSADSARQTTTPCPLHREVESRGAAFEERTCLSPPTMSPLAQSRPLLGSTGCPLSGVKRTSTEGASTSANDPRRTFVVFFHDAHAYRTASRAWSPSAALAWPAMPESWSRS
jgi:hypothetical protein